MPGAIWKVSANVKTHRRLENLFHQRRVQRLKCIEAEAEAEVEAEAEAKAESSSKLTKFEEISRNQPEALSHKEI